ncbi:MAG: 2-dehydropantoate 2-reductase [Deltaproteobacteria bacterium]|nr:2-dehydropantoate 2-reductase [Deltaproteobacteria bacterium]
MNDESDFKPKTFAVIGAGPVGCIVAAFLAKGGYKTILCDIVPQILNAALNNGIILTGKENLTQKVSAITTDILELQKHNPDVIIISTKANACAKIAESIKKIYKEGTYIVSWQNGIDTELEIARHIDKKAVIRAAVNYGCIPIGDAKINVGFHHSPHFIQEIDPKSANAAKAIAAVFTKAGLHTEHTQDITAKIWKKSSMNVSMNPVSALTGLTVSKAMNNSDVKKTVKALLMECIEVAKAHNINIGDDLYNYAVNYMENAGDHKTSMLMDIEAKRKTEIEFMNQKIVEYGEKAGIPTPYNSVITSLIKGKEAAISD